MMARRVGFVLTPRGAARRRGGSRRPRARTRRPTGPPGRSRRRPRRPRGPARRTIVAAVRRRSPRHGDAAGAEHPLGVVARGHGLGHAGLAVRGEAGQQDRRLHLGAAARAWRSRSAPGGARPVTASGSSVAPRRPAKAAPIARSGSTTRPIGRRRSDASPSSTANSGRPASRPATRRVVVPGVAAVEDLLGLDEGVAARRDHAVVDAARRARRRARRSRPAPPRPARWSGRPRRRPAAAIRLSPSASSASSRARWEMRLVAGQRGTAAQPRGRPDDEHVVHGRAFRPSSRGDRAPDRRPRTACAPVRDHVGQALPFRPRLPGSRSPCRSRTCAWTAVIACHHRVEAAEVQLLLGVGERLVGARVDLDHDPVGAHGHAADRQRLDEPALAGGVRRVHHDRQVRQVVEQRHRGQVQRVAGGRLEGPDAALAQDDLGVAGRGDVLGGHQPLLDRGAEAALEHHRPARAPAREQQREVLHVAGADLEDVGVLGDDVDLGRLHHLGDHRQARSARAPRPGSAGPRRPGPGSCTGWCAA